MVILDSLVTNINVVEQIATSKIINTSKASVLFFENVPGFYQSQAWMDLKDLLKDDYPYWAQKELEAWDFGSLALRKRVYAVAFDSEERFLEFEFPKPVIFHLLPELFQN